MTCPIYLRSGFRQILCHFCRKKPRVEPIDYVLNVILSDSTALFYMKEILLINSIEKLMKFRWEDTTSGLNGDGTDGGYGGWHNTLTETDNERIKAFQIWYAEDADPTDKDSVVWFNLMVMQQIINSPSGDSSFDSMLHEY